ncbi:hypothetical protein lerEdw1_005917 [Lerista edwardsae]|nr:hypothetical protein lerEdw1_005917 [Lerista edwardsae]
MKHLSSLVFLLLSFRLDTFAIPVYSENRDGDMELMMYVQVDPEALEMRKPRCGVPDVANLEETEGTRKWPRNDITYRIVNYTSDLPPSSVDNAIQKAFGLWSEASPLTFQRLDTGIADIMLLFASGDHGDNVPFDGPGGLLSHAFPPGAGIGGDVHFDADEFWTDQGTKGTAIKLFHIML